MRTLHPQQLGFSYHPKRHDTALWDIAFGYASGIPVRAILWYTLTRSLPPKWITRRILAWELRTGRYDSCIRKVTWGEPVHVRTLRSPND